MTDPFNVVTKSLSTWVEHVLISNIQQELTLKDEQEKFPVILGDDVHYYHKVVSGGYEPEQEVYGVTLAHTVQGEGSPTFQDIRAPVAELHTPQKYYTLQVTGINQYENNYPNNDYFVTMFFDEYTSGEQSFYDELKMDVDKREQEFSYNE
jgi:hypothetical protein